MIEQINTKYVKSQQQNLLAHESICRRKFVLEIKTVSSQFLPIVNWLGDLLRFTELVLLAYDGSLRQIRNK